MNKVLIPLVLASGVLVSSIESISVREYIQQNGMPIIQEGYLDLSHKNLTSLEGLQDIDNLDTVETLNLSYNQLQELSVGIFNNLNQLQELYLNNNKLKLLPSNIFDNLTNLTWLSLHRNQLKELPNNIFRKLDQLEALELDSNRLERLPSGIFNTLVGLSALHISNNPLQELPLDIFTKLTELEELLIGDNQLRGTTAEFKAKYLTNQPEAYLYFKSYLQETAESQEQEFFKRLAALNSEQTQELVGLASELIDIPNSNSSPDISMQFTVDEQGNTLLHKAVLLSDQVLVSVIAQKWPQLLRAKNKREQTPLHIAMGLSTRQTGKKRKHDEDGFDQEKIVALVQELLVASRTPLALTAQRYQVLLLALTDPAMLLAIKDSNGNTPIQIAIANNNCKILQYLLERGFYRLNQDGDQLQQYKSKKLDYILAQPDVGNALIKLAQARIGDK